MASKTRQMSNTENDEAEVKPQKWKDAVRQQQAEKAEQAKATKAASLRRSAKPPVGFQDQAPAPAHDGSKSRRQPRKRHRTTPAPNPASDSEDATTEEDQESRYYDLTSLTMSAFSDRQNVPKKTRNVNLRKQQPNDWQRPREGPKRRLRPIETPFNYRPRNVRVGLSTSPDVIGRGMRVITAITTIPRLPNPSINI